MGHCFVSLGKVQTMYHTPKCIELSLVHITQNHLQASDPIFLKLLPNLEPGSESLGHQVVCN